jgi:hypothetical protein
LARTAAGALRRAVTAGARFVIARGKVLFRGIAGSRIGRGVSRIGELGRRLLGRLRFRKFRFRIRGRRFRLEGYINPWILMATGELVYVDQSDLRSIDRPGGAQVGDVVDVGRRRGIVVASHTDDLGRPVSRYAQELSELDRQAMRQRYSELRGQTPEARRTAIQGAERFNYQAVAEEFGEHAADAIDGRNTLGSALAPRPSGAYEAHHILPVELITHKSPVLRRAIAAGFDFNGSINGRWARRYSSRTAAAAAGTHASHPAYTRQVLRELNTLRRFRGQELRRAVENLANRIGRIIDRNPGVRINHLEL